jgi:hypothetical protein
MIKDITITFTFDSTNNKLKIQTTNNGISQYLLDFFLHTLANKMCHEEFVVDGEDGDYIEKTFKIELE